MGAASHREIVSVPGRAAAAGVVETIRTGVGVAAVQGRGASPRRVRGAAARGLVWAVVRMELGFQMLSTISVLPEVVVLPVVVESVVRARADGADRLWGEKGGREAGPVNR